MTSPQSLLDLLVSLKGIEPDKMTPAARESFREATLPVFRTATGFIAPMLAHLAGSDVDRYLSIVTPPANPHCREWVGTYVIDETHRLERFLDVPEKVQMAAAMFPPMAFKLDLFTEAHHPGYSHDAHLQLRVECLDDPAASLFEAAFTGAAPLLLRVCEATVEFRVVSHEGAGVSIVRPKDIAVAVAEGVAAIRREAESDEPDPEMRFLERLGFEVIFDATTPPNVVAETIQILLTVFHSVNRELWRLRADPNPAL